VAETGPTGSGIGAESSAGAQGPFQFMPSTAATYNVDVTNFRSSAFGAAHLLRDLKDQYGSWNAALEGYNAGPGNIGKGVGYTTRTIRGKAASTGVTPQNSQAIMANLITPLGEVPLPGPDLDFTNPFGPLSPVDPRDFGAPGEIQKGLSGEGAGSLISWPAEMLEAFQQFTKLSKLVSNPEFWLRAAQAIGGMILLYMGLKALTGTGLSDIPGGRSVKSAAKAAAFKRLPPAQRVK
jgi:Transglycosylase SLT domain